MAATTRVYLLVTCVIAKWILHVSAQYENNMDPAKHARCNDTSCEKSSGYKVDKSAPPGFNDKTHYGDDNNSQHHPYDGDGAYNLVPPFLIGASTVIVIYIVGHCLYLHCYATRKMKRMAERHYPPAIVINDDPTSTGSYKTFTPILQYNEQGELVDGQSFLFYQPFDDDEWERQMSLRRNSSIRSSRKSSIRSMSGRKSSISLKLPKLFGSRRPSECSSIAEDQHEGSETKESPKPPRVRLLPVARSPSVPGKTDKSDGSQPQGYFFSPVVLARTQSCKSPSTRRVSFKYPQLNESASEGDLKQPLPQVIIIGTGDNAVVHKVANKCPTNDAENDDSPSTSTSTVPSTTPEPAQNGKSSTQVMFHIGEGEETEVRLCGIKEEQE